MLSERIKRLRERQRTTTPTICLDRARLVTKYYSQVSNEPMVLHRAKFFKYFLENRTIFIDEDSLLAGHTASRLVGCPVFVDVLSWLSDEIENADTRAYDPYQFLPGEKEELKDLASKWKGHILESIVRGYFEQYGEHLQVNVVDTETLRAAQKNPKELLKNPFCMCRSLDGEDQDISRYLKEYDTKGRYPMTSNSDSTILCMVEELGVSILPKLFLDHVLQNRAYRVKTCLLEKPVCRRLGLAARSFRELSPAASRLVQVAMDFFRE